MSIFEFNGRPFQLKADKLWKRDKQIFELLAQDKKHILYPCEVENADGECYTICQPLSDEQVRVLLDKDDTRPLVERIDWTFMKDFFAQAKGEVLTARRVAPVAYIPLTCHLVDRQMTVTPYSLMVTMEEYVRLTRFVLENDEYDVRNLRQAAPELYAKLTDSHRMPRAMQEDTLLLLTSAEETASLMPDAPKEDGDAVYSHEAEDRMSQICMEIKDKGITLWSQTKCDEFNEEIGDDMETSNDFIIDADIRRFCVRIGAFLPASILRAVGKMYEELDADLERIAEFCDRNNIVYCWERKQMPSLGGRA